MPVSGTLVPWQRARYRFVAASGDVITVSLTDPTEELDTILRIYDSAGNLLAENDDADQETVNSKVEDLEITADMSLIIEAATYEDALSGMFTIEVEMAE